jgi:hypothetical protein
LSATYDYPNIAPWLGRLHIPTHNQLLLMPAPDVYDQGDWNPFTDRNPIEDIPDGGILYATERVSSKSFSRSH